MEYAERVDMTNTLWLVTTFYKNALDVKDELETAGSGDILLQDTKTNLERIDAALEQMNSQDADFFKKHILSGEAFKGVCYGDALKLTEPEEAACKSFAAYYYSSEV